MEENTKVENNTQENAIKQVIIPTLSNDDTESSKLVTESVESKIKQDEIKTVYLEQESSLLYPAYLIDLSNIQVISQVVLRNLTYLLENNKEMSEEEKSKLVNVYIKTPRKKVFHLGAGDGMTLFKMLKPYIRATMGRNIKIYYGNTSKDFGKLQDTKLSNIVLDL